MGYILRNYKKLGEHEEVMPCMPCQDGKWKWGERGECKYESEEECRKAHEGDEEHMTRLVGMRLPYPHIAARIFNTPLLLDVEALRSLIAVIETNPGVRSEQGGGLIRRPRTHTYASEYAEKDEHCPEIVTMLGNSKVAVISIVGELVTRTYGLSPESGFTSYPEISRSIDYVTKQAKVSTIIFDFHTPGGEVGLVFDLADKIYALRQTVQTISLINNRATSAGYLLARAAERVVISQDGVVGGIGVVVEHRDYSKMNEMMGVKYTLLYAGDRKVDGSPYGPLSDEARNNIMGKVLYYYDLFVEKVARYSGLSPSRIRQTQADTYIGRQGVEYGLVDEVVQTNDFVRNVIDSVLLERRIITMNSDGKQMQSQEDLITALDKVSAELAAERSNREKLAQEYEKAMKDLALLTTTVKLRDIQQEVQVKYGHIPVEKEQLSEFLLFVRNADAEQAKFIESVLSACSRLVESGKSVQEIGFEGNEVHMPALARPQKNGVFSVFAEFKQHVDELKQKNASLSDLQAMRMVQKSHPKLYERYLRTVRLNSRDATVE